MGIVGGPRHGFEIDPQIGRVQKWACPACGTENLGPLEAGCPKCAAVALQQAKEASTVGEDQLRTLILRRPESPMAGAMIQAVALTETARLTVAEALAYFAEAQQMGEGRLPKAVMIAWAREISRGLDDA